MIHTPDPDQSEYRTSLYVEYKNYLYRIVAILRPEESGGWNAEVENCPGCLTQGETFRECCDNVKEAWFGWKEAIDARET